MKYKFIVGLIALALAMGALGPGSALAGAYESSYKTAITYQNVGPAATQTLKIYFYESPTDTSPIEIPRDNLASYAGTSVAVGSLGAINPGFQGTAVMSADQPLVSTLVQFPQDTAVKVWPMSNGFDQGTAQSLIASVYNNGYHGATTIFAVQNAGGQQTTATIKFIDTTSTEVHSFSQALQPGAGLFVDAGDYPQLDPSFNGSVVIETSGGDQKIVSSAMELEAGAYVSAYAFEGLGEGAPKFYMPTALCKDYGISTAYAVQNTDDTLATDVTVKYYNLAGTEVAQETKTVQPSAKQSFLGCDKLPLLFSGSGVVESDTTDIIAIGKASGQGASTAFVGVPSGSNKVAAPYVRWATNANYISGYMPRANLAIQNVGTGTIAVGALSIQYIDRDGNVLGTDYNEDAIGPGQKYNSNASKAGLAEFGCYNGCTQYGGSALIQSPAGTEVAVLVRVTTYKSGFYYSEDYTGISVE
ncbi:MAG: hypothetical protein JXA78_09525 [Anaerolineales bacterium]|nr:hypothetical protein [Anaerolineales bacterium]